MNPNEAKTARRNDAVGQERLSMKAKRTHLTNALCVMCLAWATACGDKDAATKKAGTSNPNSAKTFAPTPLEQSLAFWQQGDQEGAVQRFLQIDWKTGQALTPGSALSLTEKEFAAKPAQEREQLSWLSSMI
jgi:hypothetical protein